MTYSYILRSQFDNYSGDSSIITPTYDVKKCVLHLFVIYILSTLCFCAIGREIIVSLLESVSLGNYEVRTLSFCINHHPFLTCLNHAPV